MTKASKSKKRQNSTSGDRNLEAALRQITHEFGDGAMMRLGDNARAGIACISTGALALDQALGIGGLPRGRITEIYGPESSGKTTICLHVIANAQRAGGTCAFIDTEHALDPQWAERIGVCSADLLVSQPDCGEDALNICETLVRSNSLDVLVIDSVAALVPRAELEGQMGDHHVGLQARLMSQALRKLTSCIGKSKTCLIFTNQIREKIGVMFGSPETTSGGRALKFYCSIRLDLRRIETLKSNAGVAIGNRVRAKVVKNKLAAPFRLAEFDIMYDQGVSRAGSILDVALELKIVDRKGSWFSFKDDLIGQGREQVKQTLEENHDLSENLLAAIREESGIGANGQSPTGESTPANGETAAVTT